MTDIVLQSSPVGALRASHAWDAGYEPARQLGRELRIGLIICAALVLGIGGLAAFLPMAGAVIAPGVVSVASYVKEIAHPTGGVVADIMVRDGDRVREGQPVMRLDDTVSSAQAEYTGENVDQLLARAASLTAERDELAAIAFPRELSGRATDPNIAALLDAEREAFQLRRQSRRGMIAQLQQRIAQAQAEIAGFRSQASSYSRQADLIGEELEVTRELYEKRYTTLARLNALERSASGLSASVTTAQQSANAASSRVGELQAQIGAVRQQARSDAAAELLEVQARISELRQRKVAADDSYDRSVIKAPHGGVVDKLAYRTVGGIVPAGQTIMEIVPDNDSLIVEVNIAPADIDQIREGQPAVVRFSAFSVHATPEVTGRVTHVSADRAQDRATGAAFYRATIAFKQSDLASLGNVQLKPGMPAEAFIQTGQRTMLGYILKPLSDQWQRAFREG